MYFYGFNKILRTSRGKTASTHRSAKKMQRPADKALVKPHARNNQLLHTGASSCSAESPFILSSSRNSRERVLSQSFSKAEKGAVAARHLKTQTTCKPHARESPCMRISSRIRLFNVLRRTAPPTFLVQIMPNAEGSSA